MAFKFKFNIDTAKLPLALDKRYDVYAERIGNRIILAAKKAFTAQQKHGNEWRTSETSPPKYLASFKIRKLSGPLRKLQVVNDDPAWGLVEYGAHPGGDADTKVLRYRPLGRGLMAVAVK